MKILITFVTFLIILEPSRAYAYLDPGTGSMLLSVLIGLCSAGYFVLRKIPLFVRSALFKATRKEKNERKHIVIYGESSNYWGTFYPLLADFGKRGVEVEYLTSSENDPCFSTNLPECIMCRYIGTGNKAYTYLNFVKADVMVLTTPGVDVLQIRRSKGVKKYIHVLHSIGDFHYYKLFSFDYYDAVICNGNYQVKTLRFLEKLRNTSPKELPIAGCPYLDGLMAKKLSNVSSQVNQNCVIVAPTWGKLSMLTRFGSIVPRILAEAGFDVILRPHPQSYISDISLMNRIEEELSQYKNITWDKNPDGFASLQKAAIMVSDFSTVMFDFAFVFLRPVITLHDYNQDPSGFEAFDLPHLRWNTTVLKEIGMPFPGTNFDPLPEVVRKVSKEENWPTRIQLVRDENIANFGNAAKPVVDAIISIASKEEKLNA